MKFSAILSAVFASIAAVSAIEPAEGRQHEIAFIVDYKIKQQPELTQADVAEWTNGETITLQYHAQNNEAEEVTIIGVSGTFIEPSTGNVKVNMTAATIGPIVVAPGESHVFEQNIPLNVLPDHYLLVPQVYVAHEEKVKHVAIRGQLATVVEPNVSIFNPQLLFLELVLLATFAGFGYFVYEFWGKQYFKGTAPVAAKVKRAASPSSATASGKAYDESWIPEAHLKQKKTKKAA